MLSRLIPILLSILFLVSVGVAPSALEAQSAADSPRAATGGAQTLEDILARQRGEKVDYDFRREATGDAASGADVSAPLGTLGGVSDSELLRAMRYGSADTVASSRGPTAGVLMQDDGMKWLAFRGGPLLTYGGYLLLATIAILVIFYLVRGKIRLAGEKTGEKIRRFSGFERFSHWLTAGSFILLGVTGLISLFGRVALIPILGKESFAAIASAGKMVHNNVAWAFMLGLVLLVAQWLAQNFPTRADLAWLARAGGAFSKDMHPPAGRFNALQKLIFWGIIVFGGLISISGLSLLFPFDIPFAAKVTAALNATGLPSLFGMALADTMTPYQEMQAAQVIHSVVAFAFLAMIIVHIYVGTIGMEGAFEAMGSGEVEVQWAREHHLLWYDEVTASKATADSGAKPGETPAE